MGRLAGRVAFITGAGWGQGRHHALRLAEEGADIIAVDRGDLAETAASIEAAGRRVVAVESDVRDLNGLVAAAAKGVTELGRLDIVLADAGFCDPAPALTMTEQAWQDLIDINLTGVWKTLKATVPHLMNGACGGAVVITSSPPGGAGAPVTHYDAAKAGLTMLMWESAEELAQYGIRVNTVYPTATEADPIFHDAPHRMRKGSGGAEYAPDAGTLTRMPVATLDPDDVTNAVLYLVSDDGRYVTGTTHVVDGSGGW